MWRFHNNKVAEFFWTMNKALNPSWFVQTQTVVVPPTVHSILLFLLPVYLNTIYDQRSDYYGISCIGKDSTNIHIKTKFSLTTVATVRSIYMLCHNVNHIHIINSVHYYYRLQQIIGGLTALCKKLKTIFWVCSLPVHWEIISSGV